MEYYLSDLFDLEMGKTPSRSNPAYWTNPSRKWISISDLSNSGKYISKTKEYISEKAIKESGIKEIPANTVVMSFKLSIGKTAITAEPMFSNEAIMSFRDKHIVEIFPDYLYYMFTGLNWNKGTNKAVKGKTLNKATLSRVKVKLHNIREQRKIVHILDKVCDIIKNKEKQLSLLEDLAKSRFFEMFEDSGNDKPRWPNKKLSEICTITSSKRIYQHEQSSEGIPFWRVSDLVNKIDQGQVTASLFIPEQKYEELKQAGFVPLPGDILLTTRGTLGKCYIVKKGDKFYFQDGMISWLKNISDCITPLCLHYMFSMPNIKNQINSMRAGSTVFYLSIERLKNLNITIPDKVTQEQFILFAEKINQTKLVIQKSLEKTQLLFDSLLQKYFG